MIPAIRERVNDAFHAIYPAGGIAITATSVPEARQHLANIRLLQRQLRFIKKEVVTDRRAIQAAATIQKSKAGTNIGSIAISALFGRRAGGRVNTLARASIRQQELVALVPYQDTEHEIDAKLLELDQAKLRIERWIVAQTDAKPRRTLN
jgi:hypothetical protein